jgi:hypothetical protein
MHTVPGAQNPDWHSDNPSNYSSFWDHKDHQDRTIWLWSELAKHYRNNPWVAGYNPINEPCDPLHYRLPAFYDRFEAAIRKVDPDHILFLDGNTFAIEWKHFDNVLPNCVYALHDYSTMGFPTGEQFTGSQSQLEKLERQFLRKCSFQTSKHVPAWNGEFGPVYESPQRDPNSDETNTQRYNLLGAQLKIYQKHKTPWSIWLYKDLGLQGMVHTDPESPYHKLIAKFLEKKQALQLDAWGAPESKSLAEALSPLVKWIEENAPKAKEQYPTPWGVERQIQRAVIQSYVAGSFSDEFAELFAGKSEKELDELAASWKYENCAKREGLNKVLGDFAEARGSD